MSLPKIETPVYRVKLSGIDKHIKYRAYTVKEEKLLLMAAESKNPNEVMDTIMRLCQGCVLDDIKIEDLPVTDLEKLMIFIRSKSVGETAKVGLVCPHCEQKTDMNINLEEVTEVGDPSIENNIMLNDTYGVQLKPPTLLSVKQNISSQEDAINNAIMSVVDCVYDNENIYKFDDYTDEERLEFIDNLSIENARKITEEYVDKLPKNVIKLNYTCPHCKKEVSKEMDNVIDFFT